MGLGDWDKETNKWIPLSPLQVTLIHLCFRESVESYEEVIEGNP